MEEQGPEQQRPDSGTPRVIGRPWLPGQSGNPRGRPRKGKTLMDVLAKEVGRRKVDIVQGLVKRAISGDPKAFAEIRNTLYGMPHAKLEVISQLDSAWLGLLQEIAALSPTATDTQVVDG